MSKVEKETPTAETIFQAIANAVGEVKVLGKSERNKFDGYDFVSIDKFLALVNPICARHGLFPIISQRELEMYENTNSQGKKSVWARFFYDITLYHKSGETLGPTNIMVSVPMNGAQASGSAQSYALKQFFRALLMIPTGDKDDADLIPTETHNFQQKQPTWVETITQDLPPDATPRDKAEAISSALCAQFRRMKGLKQIDLEWDRRETLISNLESKHNDLWGAVIESYEQRRNELDGSVSEQESPLNGG